MTIRQIGSTPAPPADFVHPQTARAPNHDAVALPVSSSAHPTATMSARQVDAAVQAIRTAVAQVAHNLQFSIDEDSGRTIVRVIDTSTKEVIRQIPSEELLDISRAIDKLQGVLLHRKA